jgi:hypothetical protein
MKAETEKKELQPIRAHVPGAPADAPQLMPQGGQIGIDRVLTEYGKASIQLTVAQEQIQGAQRLIVQLQKQLAEAKARIVELTSGAGDAKEPTPEPEPQPAQA